MHVSIKAIPKNKFFPISNCMGKNSGKRYRMAFCVVKENISIRACLNQRMNKIFIAVKYNVFIAVNCLAWLTLRKWPPMPAKIKIVFTVSHFFVKKQNVLYEIELFVQSDIYQYKN